MTKFPNRTLAAIKDLTDELDGWYKCSIKFHTDHTPKGVIRDSDSGHVKTEWVDQDDRSFIDDDFHGTITWRLGDYYLITHY